MERVLVTGGAGFIGSHLVDALIEKGDEVVVLDNFRSGNRSNLRNAGNRIQIIEGDLLALPAYVEQIGPVSRIYHLAALISGHDSLFAPDDYYNINVLGTQRVIDSSAALGARRIIFASSSTVYGNQSVPAVDEGRPPVPLTTYALTKLAGEHMLRLFAPVHRYSSCSLRLFNVYGPRQSIDHPYANVTCKFSHAAASGGDINLYGDGGQSRDFLFVDDAVRALIMVGDRSDQLIYNVGTGLATSINQLIEQLEELSGSRLKKNPCPEWPNDIRAIRANVRRLTDEFGFETLTPLREGLRRTIASFR